MKARPTQRNAPKKGLLFSPFLDQPPCLALRLLVIHRSINIHHQQLGMRLGDPISAALIR